MRLGSWRNLDIGNGIGDGLQDRAETVRKAQKRYLHIIANRCLGTELIDFIDLVKMSFMPMGWPAEFGVGLEATGTFTPTVGNFPNGCHVCEVEIDPETGTVEIVGYSVVDDVGTVMNPLLVKGQIHGGIAQGAGQILIEDIAFDPETGQLLTGSFMDYAMPRADDLSMFEVKSNPVPTKTNPLGVKGCGEAGTVGAMPAVINAIVDALSPLGVRHIEMPSTPERIWRAIQGAGG